MYKIYVRMVAVNSFNPNSAEKSYSTLELQSDV